MARLYQLAPGLNAYKLTFDTSLLGELRDLYQTELADGLAKQERAFLFAGGVPLEFAINAGKYKFLLKSYGKSPLLWISSDDEYTYEVFRRFLYALDIKDEIKKLVDFNRDLIMYCGFFVIGNHLDKENWHVDFLPGSNGYTFIAPLFEPDFRHGDLLYKDENRKVSKYHYRLGEAVIFGDTFLHSTECYEKTDSLRVLVSFSIGTDKPEYWKAMASTVGTQSRFMYLPCGHLKGTCHCCD